jgi:hypothetical protein
MPDSQNRPSSVGRSRRNLLKIATIGASAIVAYAMRERPAGARVCAAAIGCACFLRGTKIRTLDGDKKIEDLAVGDLLPTVFGEISPIQWIGRYHFKKPDPTKAWVKDVLPVRVTRSALGPGVPHTDLFVTKTHALLIDDVLMPVCNLINSTTITFYDAGGLEELEFFHIKLERHNVIYAEGAPCETLREVDENAVNFAEYLREYGRPLSDTPCAPVFGFGPWVELKSRLRSAISPWFDRRQKLDIIRDMLEERETDLLRQSELTA